MIVLSEMLEVKSFNGWRETGGIKWRAEIQGGTLVIKVICPRCGRVGNLVRANHRTRVGFRIVHSASGWGCQFGWTQPEYDSLRSIYYSVRKRGRF